MVSVNDFKLSVYMWFSEAYRQNTEVFRIDFLWADVPDYENGLFKEVFIDLPAKLGYELDYNSMSFRNDLMGVNLTYLRTVKFTEMELLQKACYEN